MSQEPDVEVDSSIICAPEDAFDKFQAASMYEEDEFITLEDIAPREPAPKELPSEIDDFIDDEVYVGSHTEISSEVTVEGSITVESQTLLAETTSDDNQTENSQTVDTQQSTSNIPEASVSKQNSTEQAHGYVREKRIRKKRAIYDHSPSRSKRGRRSTKNTEGDNNHVNENGASDAQLLEDLLGTTDQTEVTTPQDSSLVQPHKTSRRGRPKKSSIQSVTNDVQNIQPQQTNGTTGKRRGRKSKANIEQNISNESDTSQTSINVSENNITELSATKPEPASTPEVTSTSLVEGTEIPMEELLDITGEDNEIHEDNINGQETNEENIDSTLEPDLTEQLQLLENGKKKRGKKSKKGHKKVKKQHSLLTEMGEDNVTVTNDASKLQVSDDDEDDNLCLSQLKQPLQENRNLITEGNDLVSKEIKNESENIDNNANSNVCDTEPGVVKVYSETPDCQVDELMDFESGIDKIVIEAQANFENKKSENALETAEDSSRRPVRRRARKKYDIESDEDPFANVESSDDEPKKRKKGYYSDDEYVPGLSDKKRGKKSIALIDSSSDDSIEEIDEDLEFARDRKKKNKKFDSPSKKGNKNTSEISSGPETKTGPEITTIPGEENQENNDIETCLQSSIIKADTTWNTSTSVFENFIAKKIQGTNIQIKKVSEKVKTPLEIPVLEAKLLKKDVEAQTNEIKQSSIHTQTSDPYAVPMKDKVALTKAQSENACEFLNNIVRATSELGQLMTEKSLDFIKKKITCESITDTQKVDYCVRKSFLLLKLAKSNLAEMEDNLAKQYEEFLTHHGLLQYRDFQKKITPKPNDDSDCEIVDDPIPSTSSTSSKKSKEKSSGIPKTVFLNKELSIKIAKKNESQNIQEKLNVKGRHTVWINDTIMVKKVKPNQSFLAQDSRNKKPPDSFVTPKMVSDFFDNYNRQRAVSICSPYTSKQWFSVNVPTICNYFFIKSDKFSSGPAVTNYNAMHSQRTIEESTSRENKLDDISPKTLFVICTEAIQKHLYLIENKHQGYENGSLDDTRSPICNVREHICDNAENSLDENKQLKSLFQLCVIFFAKRNNPPDCLPQNNTSSIKNYDIENFSPETSYDAYSNEFLSLEEESALETIELPSRSGVQNTEVQSLLTLCTKIIIDRLNRNKNIYDNNSSFEISLDEDADQNSPCTISPFDNDAICQKWEVQSLKRLCYLKIANLFYDHVYYEDETFPVTNDDYEDIQDEMSFGSEVSLFSTNKMVSNIWKVQSLKSLCYDNISNIFNREKQQYLQERQILLSTRNNFMLDKYDNMSINSEGSLSGAIADISGFIQSIETDISDKLCKTFNIPMEKEVKTLFSFCVKLIQNFQRRSLEDFNLANLRTLNYSPNTLKYLSYKVIKHFMFSTLKENVTIQNAFSFKVKSLADMCFEKVSYCFQSNDQSELNKMPLPSLTIGAVNTLSEEAFLNIEESSADVPDSTSYLMDEEALMYEDDDDNIDDTPWNEPDENVEPDDLSHNVDTKNVSWINQVQLKELRSCQAPSTENGVIPLNFEPIEELIANIKSEPQEEPEENIIHPVVVKTEALHHDEMAHIPDGEIITKQEINDCLGDTPNDPIMTEVDAEGIFSQSTTRTWERRQYYPDSDEENNVNTEVESLLVPQTFEDLQAKSNLLQCSSDENEDSNKKGVGKKKVDKRKSRAKKQDPKQNKEIPSTTKENKNQTKELTVPEPQSSNDMVAILTRKMREKIRNEEKKVVSSDSETETMSLLARKDKDNKKDSKQKKSKSKNDEEIQCSNVDSTETEDKSNKTLSISPDSNKGEKFQGFTAVDQNEITTYHKYVKYVYDQILPKVTEDQPTTPTKDDKNKDQPQEDNQEGYNQDLFDSNDPVELLECEPTMPIFDNDTEVKRPRVRTKRGPKSKQKDITQENVSEDTTASNKKTETEVKDCKTVGVDEKDKTKADTDKNYVERHGWHCYSFDISDPKLLQPPSIPLEKLPEMFVETYFQYQDIRDKDSHDAEIDKLTNLSSLNRVATEAKIRGKGRNKQGLDDPSKSSKNTETDDRITSPDHDHYTELTASEDEGANVDDQEAPPVPLRQTENVLAKNCLMNDLESDSELLTAAPDTEPTAEPKKRRPGPKSKTRIPEAPKADLMLTADKMMNKELTMLHAPVILDSHVKQEEKPDVASLKVKLRTRKERHRVRNEVKSDDSSSEEEKQWVSTKEKLLKRMVKKQDDTSVEDAKRAKLVTEFIEKRGVKWAVDPYTGKKRGKRSRCSRRKLLEKQKQMSVLSKELCGEGMTAGKSYSQTYFKGRRNIRKVLDKKSLARNTVIANMEEFERKRRLSIRQSMLREQLGCEEGVNVLVINDEVCLEYDFEQRQPIVTVHPFFTKVMKAHQYEGVKFMWDTCFEGVDLVEGGHPGGGCILAHCMGLGKTLQVLALLHTVLTHPRVGMRRVLVCCPLSTVLNWVDEIHKWMGPVTNQIKVFELSKLRKTYERAYQLEDWYHGGGIFIIGYELFRSLSTLDPEIDDIRPTIVNKIRTALLDPGPDIIVCDEGHLLKNDASVLAVSMSRVVTKRRIVLTGTPMQNNLREYYCMVNFIKPNLLGTYSEYSNRFENPIINGQHRDSSEEDIKLMKARTHILHKVLEGCLQRQEASVLYPYLPKKHEYTVFITLTKCQTDLYKHYLANYTGQNTRQSMLKDFHILQKIWSHPQVLHNFQMRARDDSKIKAEKLEDDLARADLTASEDIKPSPTEVWWLEYLDGGNMLDSLEISNKFVVVFRILEECIALGDKLLIFSTSLYTMDALEYFLQKRNKWSLGQEYYRLDGSVPAEVRQKWCREFNAEHNLKTKLFLISTRAGCLGLNMVAANRVIILDTSWNPAHDIQSIFRVYRFGQKKDCYIYRLVAMGTMEQKIYERSVTKQAVACRVVDEQQIDRHYNMAELTELYRFDENGFGMPSGVAVGVSDVAVLRVARDLPGALHALHEHDSLLRGSTEQSLPEHERETAWLQFQREQAHNQLQNQLVPIQYLTQMNYQSTMAIHSEPPQNLDIKIEGSEQTALSTASLKGKRGRRSKKQSAATTNDEDVVVNKVIEILKKKRPNSKQSEKEIKEIVGKVRKVILFGTPPGRLPTNDEMAVSIASVLLEKPEAFEDQEQSGQPEPTPVSQPIKTGSSESILPMDEPAEEITGDIPDTITGDIPDNNTITGDIPARKLSKKAAKAAAKEHAKLKQLVVDVPRGKNKKERKLIAENIVELSQDNTFVEGRRTRRKVQEMKSYNEAVVEDDIEFADDGIPDDDWHNSDTESVDSDLIQKLKNKKEKLPKSKLAQEVEIPPKPVETEIPKEPETKTKKKKLAGPLSKKRKLEEIPEIITNISQNETIDLSSDDDIPVNKIVEKEKSNNKSKNEKAAKNVKKERDDVDSFLANNVEVQEIIPLHPSLLTNNNFIKIVAHTYLSGNPMLDEDAAMLAAKYSTQKALKEVETSGKDITSGPIHEIALKVLGADVLKKLLTSTKAADKSQKHQSAVADKVKPSKESSKAVAVKREKPEGEYKIKLKPNSELMAQSASKPEPPAPETPKKLVLKKVDPRTIPSSIRLAAPAAPPQEECIVPDDIEVNEPVFSKESPVTAQKPPIVLKISGLNKKATSAPVIKIAKQLLINPGTSKPVQETITNDTICLDSDDEETPQPPPPPLETPKVVPVSLHAAKSGITTHLLPPPLIPTSNPQMLQSNSISQPIPSNNFQTQPIQSNNRDQFIRIIPSSSGSFTSNQPLMVNQSLLNQAIMRPATEQYIQVEPLQPSTSQPGLRLNQPQVVSVMASQANSIRLVPISQYNSMTGTSVQNIMTTVPINPPQLVPSEVQSHVQSQTQSQPQSQPQQTSTPEQTKKSCKPGDIIRIRNGKVEVLSLLDDKNKVTKKVEAPKKSISKLVETPKAETPKKPETSKKPEPAKPPTAKKSTEKVRKVSSSSSEESEPENDPLSILKQVVHIKAIDDSASPTSSTSKEKSHSITKDKVLRPSKSISSKPSTKETKEDSNKIKTRSKLSNENPSFTIDLTDTPAPSKSASKSGPVKSTPKLTPKPSQSAKKSDKPAVVSTALKNILITRSDHGKPTIKPISEVKGSSSSSSSSLKVTKMESLKTVAAPKRPGPSSSADAKKKKPNFPMSLKDFNIDDIDDIIELE